MIILTVEALLTIGGKMRELSIGSNDAGQRLDKYLHKYLKEATNGFIYKMLRKKNIVLNDTKADGKEIISEGDSVKLWLSEETIEKFRGTDNPDSHGPGGAYASWDEVPSLKTDEIVYEDKDILVIDKPAGELSQKAKLSDISINERILSYLYKNGDWDPLGTFTPGVCNRLDRNTSGLILAGKTLPGTRLLNEGIKNRSIKKYYIAIAQGDISEKIGSEWTRFDAYYKKNNDENIAFVFDDPGADRESISTVFCLIDVYDTGDGDIRSKLEVWLITGKSHQIRAFLAHLGHPLVGDSKYGSSSSGSYYLRAYKVEFENYNDHMTICIDT